RKHRATSAGIRSLHDAVIISRSRVAIRIINQSSPIGLETNNTVKASVSTGVHTGEDSLQVSKSRVRSQTSDVDFIGNVELRANRQDQFSDNIAVALFLVALAKDRALLHQISDKNCHICLLLCVFGCMSVPL